MQAPSPKLPGIDVPVFRLQLLADVKINCEIRNGRRALGIDDLDNFNIAEFLFHFSRNEIPRIGKDQMAYPHQYKTKCFLLVSHYSFLTLYIFNLFRSEFILPGAAPRVVGFIRPVKADEQLDFIAVGRQDLVMGLPVDSQFKSEFEHQSVVIGIGQLVILAAIILDRADDSVGPKAVEVLPVP